MAKVKVTINQPAPIRVDAFAPQVGEVVHPTEFSTFDRADVLQPAEVVSELPPAPLKMVCPWFGEIPQRNLDCMAISRATAESAGYVWELVHLFAVGDARASAMEKDRLVLDLARRPLYRNAIFLDGDVEVREIWEMQPGRPYFIYEGGRPRIGMFAVNGCTQWLVDLHTEKLARGIQDVYGYPNKLLRDKIVGLIPEACYTHHRFTSGGKNAE